jgi:hypothetical protein
MADRFYISLTSKIRAKIVLGLFLLSLSTQFVFATEITISGNGADSVNTGNVSVDQTTQATQTNTADVY